VLIADQVTRQVRGRRIVDSVSARFEPGRLHLVVGPNGAGKSTFLKMLGGEVRADSGHVRYGEADIRSFSWHALAKMRAVLSQNVEIAFPLRVREVVTMGRYPHFQGRPSAADERVCDEVMGFFDVEAMADRDYLTLSGGEQQRVHFARVLAQVWLPGTPRYLLLDEPLSFLDIHYQLEFMRKLKALAQREELVVVGVVHDLNLAARFADRLLLLHEGRLVAQGSREDVLTRENVEAVFRVSPRLVGNAGGPAMLWFDEAREFRGHHT
jgi:iron complex transport system ATP-binding protein